MDVGVEIVWSRVICKEPGRYIGWPTIVRTGAGELLVVFSGDRDEHICPWGKTEMVRSANDGDSWSAPVVVRNTPLDDRDAGILETVSGVLIVSWFTSVEFDQFDQYRSHAEGLDQAVRNRWLGHWIQRSVDSGTTWDEPVRVIGSAPHGPVNLADGRLLYLGSGSIDGKGVVVAEQSTDEGRNWEVIGTVPKPDDIGLGEPHVVEAKSGKLVGLCRWGIANIEEKYMWQTESSDGGQTWTAARKTDLLGYPPHMIRLHDDRILLVYGFRLPPFGQRARISEDEGESWGEEIVLCEGLSNDLGYPASAQLDDGSILTIYYQIENIGETTCLMGTRWIIP